MAVLVSVYCSRCGGYLRDMLVSKPSQLIYMSHDHAEDCLEVLCNRLQELENRVNQIEEPLA